TEGAFFPVSYLDEVVFSDALPRMSSAGGGSRDRFRGRAEFGARDELSDLFESLLQRERFAPFPLSFPTVFPMKDQRLHYLHRHAQQPLRSLLRLVFDDDVVRARLLGATRLSVKYGDADQLGQFERDVFDDMAEIGPFAQPLHETSVALHTTVMFRESRQSFE